jgi:hypothetical protein
MNKKEIKNVAASVLAKLRNVSKASGALFQQVLHLKTSKHPPSASA